MIVRPLSQLETLKKWQVKLERALVTANSRADLYIDAWLGQASATRQTFERLAEPGPDFGALDRALEDALGDEIKKANGTFHELCVDWILAEDLASHHGQLRGRLVVFMIVSFILNIEKEHKLRVRVVVLPPSRLAHLYFVHDSEISEFLKGVENPS